MTAIKINAVININLSQKLEDIMAITKADLDALKAEIQKETSLIQANANLAATLHSHLSDTISRLNAVIDPNNPEQVALAQELQDSIDLIKDNEAQLTQSLIANADISEIAQATAAASDAATTAAASDASGAEPAVDTGAASI